MEGDGFATAGTEPLDITVPPGGRQGGQGFEAAVGMGMQEHFNDAGAAAEPHRYGLLTHMFTHTGSASA